jgi:GTPase
MEEGTRLTDRLCPIFMVSNVTGEKLPLLRQFLNVLPSSQMDDKYVVDAPFEFQISDVFSVPFVGTVVVCSSFYPIIMLVLTYRAE